jgi:hypothetical protein
VAVIANPRRALVAAAALSAAGVAVAGTLSREVGGVVLLAGWIALVAALHAFGRAED